MRTAITIAWRHKGGIKILATPEVDIAKQLKDAKEKYGDGVSNEFSNVEVWESTPVRSYKLKPEQKEKAPEKAPEKQEQEPEKESAEK